MCCAMNLERLKHYYNSILNATVVDKRRIFAALEYSLLGKLLAFLKVDCVFDVGANEGQYARMLRRKAGYRGRIISFEPLPNMAAILRSKARRDPLWSIEETAISNADGTAEFNIMAHSQFSSLSEPRHDEVNLFLNLNKVERQVSVKTELLETALGRMRKQYDIRRPFLKMDTQGFDYKIVQAGRSVIREFVGLQSELAIKKLYTDSPDFRDSIKLYEESGFLLTAFVPNNYGKFPRLVETDCWMTRADLVD